MLYNQRICVILHLYYQDLWNDIKPYLLNLDLVTSYDLYVTITQENKNLIDDINSSFSENVNVYIEKIENISKGADIYPFIYILNKIDLDNYDIIYKIHAKSNVEGLTHRFGKTLNKKIYIGSTLWRNLLINELLGKYNVRKCIKIFSQNPQIGTIGFAPYLLTVTEDEPYFHDSPRSL